MDIPAASTPIVCDMTTAIDTVDERIAEYRRLFSEALAGRERTREGIRYRFRATSGVEAWVRDLAAREKACCAFFAYEVSVEGDEVIWDLPRQPAGTIHPTRPDNPYHGLRAPSPDFIATSN